MRFEADAARAIALAQRCVESDPVKLSSVRGTPLDFENATATKVEGSDSRWFVSIPEKGAPGVTLGLPLGLDLEVDLETGECNELDME
jgi:hypothetical protein